MEEVPREAFVRTGDLGFAYRDSALASPCGQTISSPSLVAYMTDSSRCRNRTRARKSAPARAISRRPVSALPEVVSGRALPDPGRQRAKAAEKLDSTISR